MSNGSKVALIAVVIIILGGIAWALSSPSNPVPAAPVAPTSAVTDNSAATTTAQAAPAPLDTSDASVNADLGSVDAQFQGLNSDSANADKAAAQQ